MIVVKTRFVQEIPNCKLVQYSRRIKFNMLQYLRYFRLPITIGLVYRLVYYIFSLIFKAKDIKLFRVISLKESSCCWCTGA